MQRRTDMFGRRKITSDAAEITDDNVLYELNRAMDDHAFNRGQIDYLWRYYRGEQPILERSKEIRPEICNRIVENRANEIVSFKTGYLCGEPIQYVGRSSEGAVSRGISDLNEMMLSENKPTQDKEIVEWQMICGTAYRLVLPRRSRDVDDAPFEMYTLDPRDCFVVYSNDVGNRPLFGVKYRYTEEQGWIYSVYSRSRYWKIVNNEIAEREDHALRYVPIFEYPANRARLGSFEIVLPLLDTMNNIESNRMDGMEQTIQAFIKFVNCDITEDDFLRLRSLGAIKVKSTDGGNADVDVVKSELNQDQSQTLKEDCYNAVLTICGMPNRNGGSSTSDTGAAVMLRDGWSLAEARAKDSELMFKRSEQEMLKLVLRILRDVPDIRTEVQQLRLRDIAMQFTRRNYENIQSKSQVLISMLQNEKIHPRLAFEHCGMFSDAEDAYSISEKYYEEQKKKSANSQTKNFGNTERENLESESPAEELA